MCFTIYTMDWVLQKEQNTTSRRTQDTGNSLFCYIYYMLVHSACIFFYSISVALYRYYFGIDLYIQMLSSYFHFYNDNIQTKILHMRVINNEKIGGYSFKPIINLHIKPAISVDTLMSIPVKIQMSLHCPSTGSSSRP